MARSSAAQTSFLGGLASVRWQGRWDAPEYAISMNVCLNSIILETGAVTRRPGTVRIGYTRATGLAKLLPLDFVLDQGYIMEFTNGALRFIADGSYVYDNNGGNGVATITANTAATPTVITVTPAQNWGTGDEIMLAFPAGDTIANELVLRNQIAVVTKVNTTNFSLKDIFGNSIAAASANTLANAQAAKIATLTSPFLAAFVPSLQSANISAVGANPAAVVLSTSQFPQLVSMLVQPTTSLDPVFTTVNLPFQDGPYLDPITTDAGSTVNAYSGTITFTSGGLNPFAASDATIGRQIRIFTQPAAWAAGTTYTNGEFVTDAQGAWWVSICGTGPYASSNVGIIPGTLPPLATGIALPMWAPAPTAGIWAWGIITSFTNSGTVTVSLQTPLNSANGGTVVAYRLSAWYAGNYPQACCWHEGRLWLGGYPALPNRFDASAANPTVYINSSGLLVSNVSNGVITGVNFSPTDTYGNVLDSSGISETLNAPVSCVISWFLPDVQGLIAGTLAGEFLIQSSAINDPITPTNIQAHMVTAYGSVPSPAIRAGMAAVFAQKEGRVLMEYLADAFSGKFTGKPMNERALSAFPGGLSNLTYLQGNDAPIIWGLSGGQLTGLTYRRVSRFVTENPVFSGVHTHSLGSGRSVESLCLLGSLDGAKLRLYMTTVGSGGDRQIEYMQTIPAITDEATLSFNYLVDAGNHQNGPGLSPYAVTGGGGNIFTIPKNGTVVGTDNSGSSVVFSGLYHMAGQAVTCVVNGLDCGDYTVSATGTITVPYGSDPDGYFTAAYLAAQGAVAQVLNVDGPQNSTRIDVFGTTYFLPVCIGFNYKSSGQVLRPMSEQLVKSPQGARLGKFARSNRVSILFSNTITGHNALLSNGLRVGTDLVTPTVNSVDLRTVPNVGTYLDHATLFSGVFRMELQDDYTYDTMVGWTTFRPYPVTVCAIEPVLSSEDL